MKKSTTKLTKKNVNREDWYKAIKPFDMMTCNNCLSLHSTNLLTGCENTDHRVVTDTVDKAGLLTPCAYPSGGLQKAFPIFVKLRKRFARFYPKVGK